MYTKTYAISGKIAVIVPVYRVETELCRCIDSILTQTYTDFELILVDDGSPDSCGAICEEYAAKDSRIHAIHQKNGGLSAARNAGIDWTFACSGSEWITFIDSDDWVYPEYLRLLLDSALKAETKIAAAEYQTVSACEKPYLPVDSKTVVMDAETYWVMEPGYAVPAWAKLYNISLFNGIRFPVGKIYEDEFTTYKLIFAAETVAGLHGQIYYYFQRPDSIMHTHWSLKNLVALDAVAEQLRFMENNGYNKGVKFQKEKLALEYVLQITGFEKEKDAGYQELVDDLRNQLKQFLIQNRAYCSPYSSYEFYCCAFPFYRKIKSVIKAQHLLAVCWRRCLRKITRC